MKSMPKSFQNSQAIEMGLSHFHKVFNCIESVLQQTKTTLFNIEVIRNFQMKLSSVTSKHIFKFSLSWEKFFLEKVQKNC